MFAAARDPDVSRWIVWCGDCERPRNHLLTTFWCTTLCLNPRTCVNCHTAGGPQKATKHWHKHCFFRLRRGDKGPEWRVDFDARARHVPHRGKSSCAASLACHRSDRSLATAPRLKRHARACLPCVLHGSCAALHYAGIAAGKSRTQDVVNGLRRPTESPMTCLSSGLQEALRLLDVLRIPEGHL